MARSLVSSRLSNSSLATGASPVGLASFLPIHFMGLSEWDVEDEPPPAAAAAPAPAGPCALACTEASKTAQIVNIVILANAFMGTNFMPPFIYITCYTLVF